MSTRVLIVDDNQALAENLGEILEEEGCEVILRPPEDALDVPACDVAILDLKMPGLDGITLCKTLRARHPAMRFVLMTAYATDAHVARARDAGFARVLPKPLPIEQLIELLAAIPARPSVLIVDDDRDVGESLAEALAEHGFDAHVATSIVEARASAPGRDAAVVDIRLPDGSGADLARELDATEGVQVVVLSGLDPSAVAEQLRHAGATANAVLTKPADPDALVALLRTLTAPSS